MPDQLFFDIVKMVVALACIVGLIFGVLYVLKRFLPGASRCAGERIDLRVLAQLNVGARQRIAVLRVHDRTLVVGVTEGSINTLAELNPAQPAAQKEADDPKIFADMLTWRKDGSTAAQSGRASGSPSGERKGDSLGFKPFPAEKRAQPSEDGGDGPKLFAPGERPSR